MDCEATFILKQTGVGDPCWLMSQQIRPGARGGRDQFSWDKVKEDKQRLNYLGSSIHGLPDKFKKGPETFWYAKETKSIPEKKSNDIKSEIEAIKDKEKQIMETLLGGKSKSEKSEKKPCERTNHPENDSDVRNFNQENRQYRNNNRDFKDDYKKNYNYIKSYKNRPYDSESRYSHRIIRDYTRNRSRSPHRHRNRSRSRSPYRMYK